MYFQLIDISATASLLRANRGAIPSSKGICKAMSCPVLNPRSANQRKDFL